MSVKDIVEYLGSDWTKMLGMLRANLHTDVRLLNDTNNSVLSNSGKLLRPMIALLIARATGKVTEDSIRYAAASELLHNATLMHDDVADESSERRGGPSVSALVGPGAAVLVGDFWLSRAVDTVLHAENYERVLRKYSKSLSDLSEGEILQLEKASSADTVEADYFRIIYCKTASLFETVGFASADSVNAPQEFINAAGDFARFFGIAFQIKDDILDYTGTNALGKPLGVDLKEQKITLPLLGALKGNPREKEIRDMVRNTHDHPEYCSEIKAFVNANGGVEYAAHVLDEYVGKSIDALSILPDSEARFHLVEIAHFNSYRQI